jgi:hypothetical protein
VNCAKECCICDRVVCEEDKREYLSDSSELSR